MLLRTAQKYGVRVQSLQHVLEGYKVAAEIAAHGASASTFSDWWAYKIEAYDAIPFNAALLTEAGANVCIKSDDAELMRHLNLEAAKMVKYGGVSEAQALAMITINPARELGLEDRLGSIEVGKDADIALFNAPPVRRLLAVRAVADRRRGLLPAARAGRQAGGAAGRPLEDAAGARAASDAAGCEIAAQPKGVFALVGANVHPVAGPEIPGGTVVVADGKIAAVGPAGAVSIPPMAQTIELGGLDVWPGLVDAGSTVGLAEIGSLSETQDFADAAQFQPELRTSTALHPDSEHIPVTRANGILTSFIQPTGGLISGQGCLIDLNGWVPRELVIVDAAALNVRIPAYIVRNPEGRRGFPGRPGQGPGQGGGGEAADPNARRKEQLDKIKELFRKAIAYDAVVRGARQRGESPPAPDPRLEAMLPYARGEKPVIFHAEQQVEILDALEMARELKLKAVISGGAEAWKVVEALQKAKVPVLLGGTLRLPRKDHDPYDSAYATPAKLHAAGVTFAIRSQTGGPSEATATPQPALRGGRRGRLRPPRGRGRPVRHDRPGPDPRRRRPGRLDRGRASAPTSSSPPDTSSSRRPPCWPCSSTASRCVPRAGTPSSMPSTAGGWMRSAPAAHGWGSSRPRAARSAVGKRRKGGAPAPNSGIRVPAETGPPSRLPLAGLSRRRTPRSVRSNRIEDSAHVPESVMRTSDVEGRPTTASGSLPRRSGGTALNQEMRRARSRPSC